MDQPFVLLAWVIAIVFVLTVHEFSHALAAHLMGDQTAKMQGRLTLNPLSHISWTGFFMLLLVGFGWGRPVPFNPYNLKNQKYGPALVALAGPASNLIMALISILIFKVIFPALHPLFLIYGGVGLGAASGNLLAIFLSLFIFLNFILMLFNLLPIPPLDGSKILFAFLSDVKYANFKQTLEHQGPMILLLIIIMDSVLNLNILSGLFYGFLDIIYKILI